MAINNYNLLDNECFMLSNVTTRQQTILKVFVYNDNMVKLTCVLYA